MVARSRPSSCVGHGRASTALISDAALAALEVPGDGMLAATETYDDLPPVPVHVLALD